MMYFIYRVLTNMFRPSSGCGWLKQRPKLVDEDAVNKIHYNIEVHLLVTCIYFGSFNLLFKFHYSLNTYKTYTAQVLVKRIKRM
jgi:hypothetical protein